MYPIKGIQLVKATFSGYNLDTNGLSTIFNQDFRDRTQLACLAEIPGGDIEPEVS